MTTDRTVALVRAAILEALDGKPWMFWDKDEDLANAQRLDFADRVVAWVVRQPPFIQSETRESGLGCMDCGKPYGTFPLDMTIPDGQWREIHESEGGILCANCMVARLANLPGAIAVRARLEVATDGKPS